MEKNKLTNQQQAAAQLIAVGGIEKQEIAEKVGCARATLYNWLAKDEFKAEVDRLRQDFKNFGTDLIQSKLVDAVTGYWNLIDKSNNDMVAAKGYEFFIERSLGKLTNQVSLTTEVENVKRLGEDVLDMEQEQFEKEMMDDLED